MNEQALHTRLIELEKKNLTELKIELKKGKEELDTIEQWIILDWYTMIEDYLHGADNWKNEIATKRFSSPPNYPMLPIVERDEIHKSAILEIIKKA